MCLKKIKINKLLCVYKYSDCICTCSLLSDPSVAPADAEPGWSVQEMKVHRTMIKSGISGVHSSQGSAASLREVFCAHGPCLTVDALGLFCSCITSSRLCPAAAANSPRHTHPRLGKPDTPGDEFVSKSWFFLSFWVQFAGSFLSMGVKSKLGWLGCQRALSFFLDPSLFFFFLPFQSKEINSSEQHQISACCTIGFLSQEPAGIIGCLCTLNFNGINSALVMFSSNPI